MTRFVSDNKKEQLDQFELMVQFLFYHLCIMHESIILILLQSKYMLSKNNYFESFVAIWRIKYKTIIK